MNEQIKPGRYLAHVLFDTYFGNKHFRLAQIFNFSGVALIVGTVFLRDIFGGVFSFTTGWIYVLFFGLIVMCAAFRMMMYQGGMITHRNLAKEIKKKPADADYLRTIKEHWDFLSVTAMNDLIDAGIPTYWAVRWAGIMGYDGIRFDDLKPLIPSFVQRGVHPQKFKEMILGGIADPELAANFAEHGVDVEAANALVTGFSSQ